MSLTEAISEFGTMWFIVIAVAFFVWLFIFLRTLRMAEENTTKAAKLQGRKNALVCLIGMLTAFVVIAIAIIRISNKSCALSTSSIALSYFITHNHRSL